MWNSAVEGIHEGVDDYITKPINPDALSAIFTEKLAAQEPKARIPSVSFDQPLLRTRHMSLEHEGYDMVSDVGLESSLEKYEGGGFDLLILGHSIDHAQKQQVVEVFRSACASPIVSLCRNNGERVIEGADFHIEPDPEPLLKLINEIVQKRFGRWPAAA
jgi:DNA-binding response OmpR family regulator